MLRGPFFRGHSVCMQINFIKLNLLCILFFSNKAIMEEDIFPWMCHSQQYRHTLPLQTHTPCLRKKLCKSLFVRTSSNFHQFW